MGKRKNRQHAELVAVRVLREQEWAFARRLEHKSYHQMRELASRPESAGGLGRDVSEHTLRKLVEAYRDRMAEVEVVNLAEHRERELHDLDLAQQLCRAAMAKAAEDGRIDVSATALFAKLGESRRKLLGLDMPVESRVEVVHHDAVAEELNAMLARAGRGPV